MSKRNDAQRFLIDREWPKGVIRLIPRKERSASEKTSLAEIKWRPQLAPSRALWQWYQQNPDKIDRFRARYFKELQEKRARWLPIVQASIKHDVTLLCDVKDAPWTPAHFLKEFIDRQAGHAAAGRPEPSGNSERGLMIPTGEVMKRKASRPLKEEQNLEPEQKMTFVPPAKRRVLR